MTRPTEQTYNELQRAYAHFNRALFEGTLPDCLITLQRRKKSTGYFCRAKFESRNGERTDEIAMNPMYFDLQNPREILKTLAHEMAHLWQFHCGKPARRGYHNKEWAAKMEAIGLMPSSTGHPGGKKVGEHMSDYVIDGGAFDVAYTTLMSTGFSVTWRNVPISNKTNADGTENDGDDSVDSETETEQESGSTRRKFACPQCNAKAWGKPKLKINCGVCGIPFADVGK